MTLARPARAESASGPIYVGSANLTLTTHPDNELGLLIGGGSTGFPVLQQFNTFSTAHMQVAVAP